MYALCVGQGWVSPSEFWSLAPGELWWLIDAKMPKGAIGAIGDVDELHAALMAAKAEEEIPHG